MKREAIVDWYKNSDVKRRIKSKIDDYLYDVVSKEKGIDLKDCLAKIEKKFIQDAMERVGGSCTEAAKLLKMKRSTLNEKLIRIGIK